VEAEVMYKTIAVSILLLIGCGVAQASAKDGFERVSCNADIAKALIGQCAANERIVVIEARHKDLRLKDLGSSESSDNLTTISWMICSKEFVLLEHNSDPGTIYDAVEVPTPSADDVFIGQCELNGKEMKDSVVAVLSWPPGSNPLKLRQPEYQKVPAIAALENRRGGPEICQNVCTRSALLHLRRIGCQPAA
jgi:hypothetical protein